MADNRESPGLQPWGSSQLEEIKRTALADARRRHTSGTIPKGLKSWREWWESKFGEGQTVEQYEKEKTDGRD